VVIVVVVVVVVVVVGGGGGEIKKGENGRYRLTLRYHHGPFLVFLYI